MIKQDCPKCKGEGYYVESVTRADKTLHAEAAVCPCQLKDEEPVNPEREKMIETMVEGVINWPLENLIETCQDVVRSNLLELTDAELTAAYKEEGYEEEEESDDDVCPCGHPRSDHHLVDYFGSCHGGKIMPWKSIRNQLDRNKAQIAEADSQKMDLVKERQRLESMLNAMTPLKKPSGVVG